MQTKMTVHQSGLHVPISQAFVNVLHDALTLFPPHQPEPNAVTLNFRDPQYTAETGGFHPVEIRLVMRQGSWYFDYLTDFSYMGHPWPELEKEMDINWSQQTIWHAMMGDVAIDDGGALFELWQRNFIHYWRMDIYRVAVHWEH